MARRPVIAGNWKMHFTASEAVAFVRELIPSCGGNKDVEVVVAPPFTALYSVAEALKGSGMGVAAQNCHHELKGAFTGEVSVPMLKEVGCGYVIIGHSERRQFFCETDDTVNRKLAAVMAGGLVPIVCVGETLEQREKADAFKVIDGQLAGGLSQVGPQQMSGIILAYEPVWAIGTGKTASPEQAQEVHASIRGWLTKTYGSAIAEQVRIQYGGSVKPDNVRELMSCADIDGALVGGASMKADSFAALVNYSK